MADKVFIRNVPDDLWRALKARASLDGKTVSEAVREAVQAYLAGPRLAEPAADAWDAITALGASGHEDTSEAHDEAIAQAVLDEAPRTGPAGRRGRR